MYFIRQVSSNDYLISNCFHARARRFGVSMSGIGSRNKKIRSRKELDEREWKRDLADAFHNHLGTWSWLTRALPFSVGLCSSIAYKPQFAVNPARVAGSSRYNAFALRLSKPPVPGIDGKFYSSAFFSSLPVDPRSNLRYRCTYQAYPTIKRIEGDEKKREKEKTASFGKPYPPLRTQKSNFSISLSLTQTCCFASFATIFVPNESSTMKINDLVHRHSAPFSLDSISFSNQRAIRGEVVHGIVKTGCCADSRALPNQQLRPPVGAVDISGRRGRVYTRPPTVSLLTSMGRRGTEIGVGE